MHCNSFALSHHYSIVNFDKKTFASLITAFFQNHLRYFCHSILKKLILIKSYLNSPKFNGRIRPQKYSEINKILYLCQSMKRKVTPKKIQAPDMGKAIKKPIKNDSF